MNDNVITVSDLSFGIKNKSILKQISLQIGKNKFIGIVGPNGSGKTTFIKHLYRAISPENNVVIINGEKIENITQRELAKQITVMKQENSSDFDYTVYEMTLMGRAPYRKSFESYNKDDETLADTNLKIVGMFDKKNRTFSTLSGGEKQRVLIARSLTQGADILLLDEPTNHLDIYYQLFLVEMLHKLDKTIVSVFHDLNLASRYCDYIYVIKQGEIVSQGESKDVLTEKMLEEVFHIKTNIEIKEAIPYIAYLSTL